jgi:hypothetical protein
MGFEGLETLLGWLLCGDKSIRLGKSIPEDLEIKVDGVLFEWGMVRLRLMSSQWDEENWRPLELKVTRSAKGKRVVKHLELSDDVEQWKLGLLAEGTAFRLGVPRFEDPKDSGEH